MESEKGFVTLLADSLGSGEKSIRLLLCLFAGYILAFLYRGCLHGRHKNLQHVYFTITGLAMCYFNFGFDSLHSVANITVIWLLVQMLGGSALSVGIAFIFNTAYLLAGYWNISGEEYDISWATPHCVLTLRLTGVVFDLYDGRKKKEKLTSEQKETALHEKPTLLEMAGHVYFFGAFLTGPQFSMKRYQSFVTGAFSDKHTSGPPHNVSLALMRLLLGVVYIAAFQLLCAFIFTNNYMLTDNFRDLGFLTKCVYILIWGKLTICKYVGCWLLAEGSCILTGLTYNGKDINGNTLWNGCTNAKLIALETSTTFREMISGFNVNTNNWMSRYVFKRMKFLGSKEMSQLVTLTYLAVWHGLHSGYYMNFFLEFIMLNGETQLSDVIVRYPSIAFQCSRRSLKPIVWIVKKTLLQFFVSYALVSFVHLKWHRYSQVYSSVNYIGHVTFVIIPVICILIKLRLGHPRKSTTNGHHHISNGATSSEKKTS